MTLGELLKNKPTLDQLDILMRADQLFTCGRFWGGPITSEQIENLIPKKLERKA